MNTMWLRRLYDYNHWANRHILSACAKLSDEQRRVPIGPGYGSVHDTLVHTARVQWNWLQRCQGDSPRETWESAQFPTFEAIRTRWEQVEADTAAFVETLTDTDLETVSHYVTRLDQHRSQPRWEMLLHQALHAQQHRAELALYLTAAGHSPGDMDLAMGVYPAPSGASGSRT